MSLKCKHTMKEIKIKMRETNNLADIICLYKQMPDFSCFFQCILFKCHIFNISHPFVCFTYNFFKLLYMFSPTVPLKKKYQEKNLLFLLLHFQIRFNELFVRLYQLGLDLVFCFVLFMLIVSFYCILVSFTTNSLM